MFAHTPVKTGDRPYYLSVLLLLVYYYMYSTMIIVLICMCIEPRFRFSRSGLSDVSVSVVNIAADGVGHTLEFTASPNTPLPVADGLANNPLPAGCSVSSLEFNTFSGWVVNDFNGFSLVRRDSASYLEVPSNQTLV